VEGRLPAAGVPFHKAIGAKPERTRVS